MDSRGPRCGSIIDELDIRSLYRHSTPPDPTESAGVTAVEESVVDLACHDLERLARRGCAHDTRGATTL